MDLNVEYPKFHHLNLLREIVTVVFHGSVISSAIGNSQELVLLEELLDLTLEIYSEDANEELRASHLKLKESIQ